MSRVLILALFSGLFLFPIACRQEQAPATTTTPGSAPQTTATPESGSSRTASGGTKPVEIIGAGYRMVKYTDLGGQRPKLGEVALVNMSNWVGDSLIIDSRTKMGGPMSLLMMDRNEKPTINAVFDAVLQMGIGDSISVYQPVTPGLRKQLSPRLANAEMRSDLVLIGITTKDAIKKMPLRQ